MKKLTYILSIGLIGFSLLASANNGEKKAVVSNYSEVLSQIEYPQVCREQGIEGTVLVRVSLDAQGQLIGHEFVKFPCADLKDAVSKVLPLLNFQAAIVDGEAVSSKLLIPIDFRLTY